MRKKYFMLQLKRVFKLYPTILLITLATVASIVIACVVLLQVNNTNDKKNEITLGIVGDVENTYIDIGLNAIRSMDSLNFHFECLTLSEDDAIKALKSRDISGYLQIPDNYIENILRGRNIPAKYVTLNAPEGFGSIISAEIAETASDIVTESQIGIYSMQEFMIDHEVESFRANTDALMLRYMDFIINRNEIYNIINLGISDSISLPAYYICGLLLLFIMLWGISCSKIFTGKNNEYSKLLNISGITPRHQFLCEYTAYLIVTLTTLVLFASVFGGVVKNLELNIPELVGVRIIDCVMFIVKIVPVVVMITLMQTAVYELIQNNITALLMQFLLTIVLGYISGCFYPTHFFPETLQKIIAFLPIGAGFSYMRQSMTGFPSFVNTVAVLGYAVVFFSLTSCVKKCRIAGDTR